MNPRDYQTWTSLADHPFFSPRAVEFADWSSSPDVYADRRELPAVFNPDWYVHQDPPLPTAIQAECAVADICDSLSRHYGQLDHELFILDDLTVFVRAAAGVLVMDIYPVHRDDSGTILLLFVESPIEIDEMSFAAIADVAPKLDSLIGKA